MADAVSYLPVSFGINPDGGYVSDENEKFDIPTVSCSFDGRKEVRIILPMPAVLHIWNVLAAALWLVVLAKRLRHIYDKQDHGVMVLFAVAGLFSFPILYTLVAINPIDLLFPRVYRSSFLYYVLLVGPTEELAKFGAFAIMAVPLSLLKEPQDGVIHGAIVGVIFGTIENIGYIQEYGASVAMRPILTTGGHAVYTAITAGIFSQALHARRESTDPHIRQRAIAGIVAVAAVHGLYNWSFGVPIPALGQFLSSALDGLALAASFALFHRLVEESPYRVYPLSHSKSAIPRLTRGLDFNRGSTLLNRNLGFYLMHEGSYRAAAMHLRAAIPRARDPRRARFFSAVCDLKYVPEARALRTLRSVWASLGDKQRTSYISQLSRLIEHDPELLGTVNDWIARNFRKDFIPKSAMGAG